MRISAGREVHDRPFTVTRAPEFPYWTIGSFVRGRYHFETPWPQARSPLTFDVEGPSLISIQPRTPYCLTMKGGADWVEYYMMFTPREEWIRWLDWPSIAPGISHLRLDSPLDRRRIFRAASDVYRMAASSQPDAESFAYNALERFLLVARTINPGAGAGLASPRSDPRIATALEFMGRHLADPLTVETIAQAVGMSASNLAHLFRRQIGEAPMRYLEASRLRRARELLLRTDRRISDIAGEVGFENAFHFSTRFRKATAQSPREYRKRPNAAS